MLRPRAQHQKLRWALTSSVLAASSAHQGTTGKGPGCIFWTVQHEEVRAKGVSVLKANYYTINYSRTNINNSAQPLNKIKLLPPYSLQEVCECCWFEKVKGSVGLNRSIRNTFLSHFLTSQLVFYATFHMYNWQQHHERHWQETNHELVHVKHTQPPHPQIQFNNPTKLFDTLATKQLFRERFRSLTRIRQRLIWMEADHIAEVVLRWAHWAQ